MKRNRSRVLRGVMGIPLWVSLATVGSGQAQTLVSTFGPSNTFSNNGWCVSGASTTGCGPAVTRWVAAPFTIPQTATVSGITLALVNLSGGKGVVINLRGNSGGQPGTILTSASANAPSSGTLTVTPSGSVTLQAATTYWLEVESSATDGLDYWYTSFNGGGGSTNVSNAGWTALTGYGGITLPAFSLSGSTGSPGTLSISPALTFTMTAGGPLPANQNVTFTSSSGTIAWSFSTSVPSPPNYNSTQFVPGPFERI